MALVEGRELAELARYLRSVVGTEPAKRLERLKEGSTKELPAFGPLDGSDGPFLDWLSACNREQLLLVLQLLPQNPIVDSVLDRLDGSVPEHGDEPEEWHFLGRRVLLGRLFLKDKIAELVSGTHRVAIVNGKRFSGKTFTHLIMRGKARLFASQIDVVHVNVMQQNTVRKIAVSAVSQMLGDPTHIPTNDASGGEDRASTQNTWVNLVADWIAAETRRDRALQRWLVFDGYARIPQDPDIAQLTTALAVRAKERIDEPNGFRVIFLDHPDLLPPDVIDVRETIERIEDLEVQRLLEATFKNKKPEDLVPIMRDVIANTEEDTRLALFQERLSKIVFKDRPR